MTTMAASSVDPATATASAKVDYVHKSTTIAIIRRDVSGNDHDSEQEQNALQLERHTIQVQNMRLLKEAPTMDRQGFCLRHDANPAMKDVDFLDNASVLDRYYPICEALVRKEVGPNVIVRAFDHNVRMSDADDSGPQPTGGAANVQSPIALVHGDYTKISAPRRLSDLALQPPKVNDVWNGKLPPGRATLLDDVLPDAAAVQRVLGGNGKRRFAIVNVWRSIDPDKPISTNPLGCLDATTTNLEQDLRTLQIQYADRVGENFIVVAQPQRHVWMYAPAMTMDQVLLIKQWDSAGDFALGRDNDDKEETTSKEGRSTLCLHAALVDWQLSMNDKTTDKKSPTTETSRARKSIEVRCICLWPEDVVVGADAD